MIDFVDELQQRGFSKAQADLLLDSGLPLGFSVYVGARFDCGAQFSATVILTEQTDNIPR